MRTFTYSDDTSNKFWNIDLQGKTFTVQFGRIGTAGQTQTKAFPDADKAKKAYEKLIAEKLAKGYTETTSGGAPTAPAKKQAPITPMQEMLEKAIGANFNDLAAHAAYADFLMEQNDPRGELIQTQLALEDSTRSAAERKTLAATEKKLLKKLAPTVVGQLHSVLDGSCGPDKSYHYDITRGWFATLRTLPFPNGIFKLLEKLPEARLLQRLEIVYDMAHHPWDFDGVTADVKKELKALAKAAGEAEDEEDEEDDYYDSDIYDEVHLMRNLIDSRYLTNLRAFKLGFSDREDDYAHSTMTGIFNNINITNVMKFITQNPHLEELYLNTHIDKVKDLFSHNFPNLKVLQYYYGQEHYSGRRSAPTYPLSAFAKNKSLTNIHTLKFHPGRDAVLAIEEVTELLKSKNLPNLRHLQLHMTNFGNDMVKPLISSKIMQRLKVLDIGYGNMNDDGAEELAACPDLKNLELLNVTRNALTAKGIKTLKATKVNINFGEQHDAEETDYLYEVDRE